MMIIKGTWTLGAGFTGHLKTYRGTFRFPGLDSIEPGSHTP